MADRMSDSPQSRLAALYEVSSRLGTTQDLGELLDWVMDSIIILTAAERGFLVLLDETTGELRLAAARDGHQNSIGYDFMTISHVLVEPVVSGGQGIIVDNATEDGSIGSLRNVTGNQPWSIMCTPIRVRGRIIGAAYVDNRLGPNIFDGEDLDLLVAFASQAFMAIENWRLYEAIQAADRAKSDFIFLVTHELRVPMTSISGYTDLILSGVVGPISERQTQFLTTIKRNLNRMSTLVDDLSDINYLEIGRMKLDRRPFDLGEVLQEVVRGLNESIDARQQKLIVDVSPELPEVYADRMRVSRVLDNLIKNSNLYTPDGGTITVRVRSTGQFAETQIIDTGIGISEDDQSKLFVQFFRSEDRLVRQRMGWGLGLALAKKLIEAQGGTISCTSKLREGSTFVFTLPLTSLGNEQAIERPQP